MAVIPKLSFLIIFKNNMEGNIKIVGVQYAVNPTHVKDAVMTAQEQQNTVDFLTMLDRNRPSVSIKPEPTNETDEEAFVARFRSHKIGYVRNLNKYKGLAQAAFNASGRGYFRARVVEVKIAKDGYFYVEPEIDAIQFVPIAHKDHWKEWESDLPLYPMTEEFLCIEDAVMMMKDILAKDVLSSDDEEELLEYTKALVATGKHALWCEAKEGMESIIIAIEAKAGDKMRHMSNEIEHLLTGMCNEGRLRKLREKWLPRILSAQEAERSWHDWLHLKGADCHELDNLEMMAWLEELEKDLSNISALAPYSIDDEVAILTRAHYTRIPLVKFRQLLTVFVIRDRLRKRLGLPTNSFPPTPSLSCKMESHLIDTIIKYSQTLSKREDVEVLQRFIYHEISYLPPEYKLRVDNMTERFLSEEERQRLQTMAIQEQTAALKDVAMKPSIKAEHYHAGNSTFDDHSKHLHLDHQDAGNSALLPSAL